MCIRDRCRSDVPEAMTIKSVRELIFFTFMAIGSTALISSKVEIILFFSFIVISIIGKDFFPLLNDKHRDLGTWIRPF